jgi:hypothetical protein
MSPRSEPRAVPFEDQIQRAMRRIERPTKVPLEVAARWEQRLRALGAELGLPADGEPTDAQLAQVVRELYEAEADVKDAGPIAPPPLEATLASAVSPIAVRIAQTATKPDDADGETTLSRDGDRPAALPRPNDEDSEDGRDTGEDMTKVFSKKPGEADAQIPGVEVKPANARPTDPRGRSVTHWRGRNWSGRRRAPHGPPRRSVRAKHRRVAGVQRSSVVLRARACPSPGMRTEAKQDEEEPRDPGRRSALHRGLWRYEPDR